MNLMTVSVGMLGTNCYIAGSAKSCAVIDPGAQPEKIIAAIEGEGLDVRYILLTHGHHDHIGGVRKLMEKFPDAELFIGKNDLEMLTDGSKSYARVKYDKSGDFFIEQAKTLSDGDVLEFDGVRITVLETPGHTKGGVCYICDNAIFSGDTLFFGDVGRCDLYGGDYGVMKQSLLKIIALNGDYGVYPGHGEATTLDYERQNNPYIAEAVKESK